MTTLRKAFTLIEMLVVIMIIAILAAALFPAISAAIAQAKSTAMKNKGKSIWIAIISANAEREPLGMLPVWPTTSYTKSTDYFKFLMGYNASTWGDPICEDLKAATFMGPGMQAATKRETFDDANNAWCILADVASNATVTAEDAFIYTRNIDFGSATPVGGGDIPTLKGTAATLKGYSLNRGVYVSYGGACIDRREKYIGKDPNDSPTNNLVNSTNMYTVIRPAGPGT